ncbi:hypothetical protein ACFY5C_18090 [Streptomyces sp. NPDC012935]|uniref:hypothetical protein n=1 Tax=Streptomyces sp. NPDC012935 TaxID=3364857 RepID=UPI0036C3362F
MITSQKAPLRAAKRIVSVGAALGIALALGTTAASTAAATPAHQVARSSPADGGHGHHHDHDHHDGGGCSGLLVLLCN